MDSISFIKYTKQRIRFCFPVRASDKRIACEEEFSDSEDEGEGRRDNQTGRVGRSRKRNRTYPIENMVANGNAENANDDDETRSTGSNNANNGASKPATTAVAPENKTKPSSGSPSPREGSPKTVGSTTAAENTEETTTEPEASRTRYSSSAHFILCPCWWFLTNMLLISTDC